MFDMKYLEAADFLGVSLNYVSQLVSHDKLHPRAIEGSHEKLLDRAEVIRYKFRKQPEKAEEQIRALEAAKAHGTVAHATQSPTTPAYPVYPSITFNPPDRSMLEWMKDSGIGYKVTPTPTGEVIFQPALVDETGNSVREQEVSPGTALAIIILLGLISLFFLRQPQEVREELLAQLEKAIRRMGLEKEDLAFSQRKAVAALMSHPREAKQIEHILEREKILVR